MVKSSSSSRPGVSLPGVPPNQFGACIGVSWTNTIVAYHRPHHHHHNHNHNHRMWPTPLQLGRLDELRRAGAFQAWSDAAASGRRSTSCRPSRQVRRRLPSTCTCLPTSGTTSSGVSRVRRCVGLLVPVFLSTVCGQLASTAQCQFRIGLCFSPGLGGEGGYIYLDMSESTSDMSEYCAVVVVPVTGSDKFQQFLAQVQFCRCATTGAGVGPDSGFYRGDAAVAVICKLRHSCAEAVPHGPAVVSTCGPAVLAHRCNSWTRLMMCPSWFNDRCRGPDSGAAVAVRCGDEADPHGLGRFLSCCTCGGRCPCCAYAADSTDASSSLCSTDKAGMI